MGDVVLVTGCRAGIGYETALAFGRGGFTVYATMRSPQPDEPLAEAVARETLPVVIDDLDVTDAGAAERVVARILAETGRIDVLVNNAGLGYGGTVEEMPEADARAVFETNFWGPFRLIRLVLPSMRATRGGVVLNVSSYGARLPAAPTLAIYTASKHALSAMTDALRWELATTGVRAVAIEAGFFATGIYEHRSPVDAASPYGTMATKVSAGIAAAINGGNEPAVLAEAIVAAARDEAAPTRLLVGEDATAAWEAFNRLGFEDWETVTGRMFHLSGS